MNDLVDRDARDSAGRRSSLDDNAYYQAQVESLNRDNRMLKARIRVLERQIAELSASSAAATAAHTATTTTTVDSNEMGAGGTDAGDGGSAGNEPEAADKNATG